MRKILLFVLLFLAISTSCSFGEDKVLYLDLLESLKIAVRNNPTVKRADATIEKYYYKVKEVECGYVPKLDFGAGYIRMEPVNQLDMNLSGTTQQIRIGEENNNLLKLSMNQLLYSFGRVENSKIVSELNLKNTKLDRETTLQDLLLQTKTAYFNVLRTRDYVKVAKKSVESSQKHLKLSKDLYDEGVVPKYDVLNMETNLSQSQQEFIKAENAYLLAKNTFKNILNLEPGVSVEIVPAEGEAEDTSFVKDEEESIKIGLERRPEAKQVEVNLEVARGAVKLASTGNYPNLTFAYNYYWRNKTAMSLKENWDATAYLLVPLFDGGVTRMQVQQAEGSLKQVEATATDIINNITLDIKQSLLNLKDSAKMLETTQRNLAQAEEALSIAEVRYEAAISTATELTDAQYARDLAEFSYSKAVYDYKTALARYKKAIGWEI